MKSNPFIHLFIFNDTAPFGGFGAPAAPATTGGMFGSLGGFGAPAAAATTPAFGGFGGILLSVCYILCSIY